MTRPRAKFRRVLNIADDAERDNQAELKAAVTKRLKELQVEQQKKEIAKQLLTPQAYERLMNVRISNYTLYSQFIELLVAMSQRRQIYGKVTEEQLKDLLAKLTYRPSTGIQYRHK